MEFFEFDEVIVNENKYMFEPHSHDFYELYFLLDGEREFFVDNKMFKVSANTLVVVPPFCIHKTEGGPYKRININISPDLLSQFHNEFLMNTSKEIAVKIDKNYIDIVTRLLKEGTKIQSSMSNNKVKVDCMLSLVQTIIYLLSIQNLVAISASSTAHKPKNVSPEVLKILSYINLNYNQQIQLKDLCDKFFLSKVSLCKKFKNVMNCSIMEYVSRMRLSKAKLLLRDTNKSIEEIAVECGFSSANYFGLIFKKEVGLSPLNYKKTR